MTVSFFYWALHDNSSFYSFISQLLPSPPLILIYFRAWSLQENYPLSFCAFIITKQPEERTKIGYRVTKYRELSFLFWLPTTEFHPPPPPIIGSLKPTHILSLSTLLLTPTGKPKNSHVFSPYSMLFYRAITCPERKKNLHLYLYLHHQILLSIERLSHLPPSISYVLQ